MKIKLENKTCEIHDKENKKYFYVYDEENPLDLLEYEEKYRIQFSIIGTLREYTEEKIYDMDIADWSWYSGKKEAPNYKHRGYGKALFTYIMEDILTKKENPSEWKITIGHSLDDAISFYEYNFVNENKQTR